MMIDDLPILGICGWSGSGKTSLIEELIPSLLAEELKVAVVKHDAHGLEVDRLGKDSDRFFRAGADVLLQGPGEEFFRSHSSDNAERIQAFGLLAERYDLVLVEGHKATPLRKLWLLGGGSGPPPAELENVAGVLAEGPNRPAAALAMIQEYLASQWLKTAIHGCVLIGGKSERMGKAKHLLEDDGQTWLERTVELLEQVCTKVIISGVGRIPQALAQRVRLEDVPDGQGPISGVLSAMRWAPGACWLVAACDLPDLSVGALEWLVSTRRPGVWATLPRLEGSSGLEPLLAHYDLRCRSLLEGMIARGDFKLAKLGSHRKVSSPTVPAELAGAWRNVNTQDDLSGDQERE